MRTKTPRRRAMPKKRKRRSPRKVKERGKQGAQPSAKRGLAGAHHIFDNLDELYYDVSFVVDEHGKPNRPPEGYCRALPPLPEERARRAPAAAAITVKTRVESTLARDNHVMEAALSQDAGRAPVAAATTAEARAKQVFAPAKQVVKAVTRRVSNDGPEKIIRKGSFVVRFR